MFSGMGHQDLAQFVSSRNYGSEDSVNDQSQTTPPDESPRAGGQRRSWDGLAVAIAALSLVLSSVAIVEPARQWIDDYFGSFISNRDDIPIPPLTLNVQTSGYRQDNDGDIWSARLRAAPHRAWRVAP